MFLVKFYVPSSTQAQVEILCANIFYTREETLYTTLRVSVGEEHESFHAEDRETKKIIKKNSKTCKTSGTREISRHSGCGVDIINKL